MSAQSILEQLLKSGMSLLDSQGLGGGKTAEKSQAKWGQIGGGVAAGSALGLLLGSKRGRSFGGQALKYGSMAALGAVAYKAFNAWQAQQAPGQGAQATPAATAGDPLLAPRSMELLRAPSAELHSQALLLAMIAAAKADGHLDARERGLVEAELGRLEADPVMRRWLEDQLSRPLDPAEVARAASTPALGAEMYLASLLMADQTSFMERAYLDELAQQLRLPAGLKAELEVQASAV